jgi:Na+-driven multidrug efflux pump
MREMAGALLFIIGGMQLFESANTILGKALQGAGVTRLVMYVSAGFQWVLFLPLAWFLALTCEMGAVGAMLALMIQTAGAGGVLLIVFLRGHWMHGKV